MRSVFSLKYYWASLLFCTLTAFCQAQLTLTGEVRPRSEFRNGFKTPTTSANQAAFFIEQRSRIYFDYTQPKYKFRLSLQDVRIWGENAQIFKQEDGNTFLSEAWGQYFLTDHLSLKAGRQIISYDNQRFLGGLEWAQQGRRHDALLMMYEKQESKTKLHLGAAFNSDDDIAEPAYLQSPSASFYSVSGNYKSMQYAWFHKDFAKAKLSLLGLNAIYQNPDDSTTYAKQTFGAIGSINLSPKLTIGGDVYYQTGKVKTADVNALLAGGYITLKTKLTPIKVGLEHISGKDDSDTENTIRHFTPDFGTNHAHNGFMDYYFVGPANGTVGVTDIYLKTKFKLKKGSLIVNLHEFLTGSEQLNESGTALARNMGAEVDLVYAVALAPDVMLNLGYSHLLASETMLALRPGNTASNNWAWAMLTFKPTLFSTKED
ncbi:MAG: alginate export family protein [Bacteroidota bacterium]